MSTLNNAIFPNDSDSLDLQGVIGTLEKLQRINASQLLIPKAKFYQELILFLKGNPNTEGSYVYNKESALNLLNQLEQLSIQENWNKAFSFYAKVKTIIQAA